MKPRFSLNRWIALFAWLGISCGASGWGWTKEPTELRSIREAYLTAAAATETPVSELKKSYADSLEKLMAEVTASGDLEKVIAIKAELDFLVGKEGPRPDAGFPEFQRLRRIYDEQFGLRVAERDAKLEPLRAAYQQKLSALQVELTRAQRIDEALLVKSEAEKVAKGAPVPEKTAVPGSPVNADIPEGAIELDGRRYFLFKTPPRHWEQAKAFCESKGGQLAIINSRRELEAMADLRKTVLGEKSWVWLGGSMPEGDDRWLWIDGSPLSKRDPWSNAGEFEVPHAEERYLVFGPGDKFMGYRIDSGFVGGFICEWESSD